MIAGTKTLSYLKVEQVLQISIVCAKCKDIVEIVKGMACAIPFVVANT